MYFHFMRFIKISFLTLLYFSFLFADEFVFKDESIPQGLIFSHDRGGSGERYYIETIGAGVCLFDYDNDTDLDIYFCQGSLLPGRDNNIILENKLFRNDNGKWKDVTDFAGVGDTSYSFGCACGDVDNDGDSDLYITNFGTDTFFKNNGDGTFTDMTSTVGLKSDSWSSSAAFFDMNNDGLLDLYVTSYVEYSLNENPWCGDRRKNLRDYCKPDFFPGIQDYLFQNQGDWIFKDVSNSSGLAGKKGKGLGVIPADFDLDGDLDLYVANDKVMNHYFINDGQGYFEENAIFTGVGFNENGLAEAGMGVDIGDINGDGWQDIFVTNFSGESNTIYINNRKGFFSDETFYSGIVQPSFNFVGFGTKLLDLDHDGWLDLFVINGHVAETIDNIYNDHTYAQRKQIFINNHDGSFREIPEENIGDAKVQSVGRGGAFGDIDNDGDIDVVVSNNNSPANLLIRSGTPESNWIGFLLVGTESNKDAIGARVTVQTKDIKQTKFINTAGSYLASNDKRVVFGLNNYSSLDKVTIYWPSGVIDTFINIKANQYYQILEKGQISTLNY